jgi:hypothetical protein
VPAPKRPSAPPAFVPVLDLARLISRNPCTRWWLTAVEPADKGASSDACLTEIRALARDYRIRALGPLATASPSRWSWLPGAADLARQSIAELLAFKADAARVILTSGAVGAGAGRGPGGSK